MAGFRSRAAIINNWHAIVADLAQVEPFSPEADVLMAGLRRLKREYQAGVDADWKPKAEPTARRPVERRDAPGRHGASARVPGSSGASPTSHLPN